MYTPDPIDDEVDTLDEKAHEESYEAPSHEKRPECND